MNKYLKYFLIGIILVGIFLRFYQLEEQFIYSDEKTEIIAGLKMHHQSLQAGVNYEGIHPPLAKWLMGVPTKNIERNFLPLDVEGVLTYSYETYEIVKENYVSMRYVSAIAGGLIIIFIYLLTRKIFGSDAAIWAAVLMSISADMIFLSRIAMNDNFLILFSLLTLFFYIQYLNSSGKRRYIFILLTSFFLFFTLGTRAIQPLFIIPTIIAGQIFFKRKKSSLIENLLLLVLIIFSVVSVYSFLYSQHGVIFGKFGAKSIFDLIGFSFPRFFWGLIFRNGYLHLFSLFLIFYFALSKLKLDKTDLYKKIFDNKGLLVLILYFLVSSLVLGLSKAGDDRLSPFSTFIQFTNRYAIVLYPALFVLGGYSISKMSKGIFTAIPLLLIALTIYFLVPLIPNYLGTYSNFGIRGYEILDAGHVEDDQKTIEILKGLKNPPILTNEINLLIFYEPSFPLFTIGVGENNIKNISENYPYDPRCSKENMEILKKDGFLIVYRKTNYDVNNFLLDPSFCYFFRDLNLAKAYETNELIIYAQTEAPVQNST